jgi:hypothetical protein
LNFERIVLSLVYTKIAGSVPTWTSLQVLESELPGFANATECPYLGEGRCPHAGTGEHWLAFNSFRQILSALIRVTAIEDNSRLRVELPAGQRLI